MTLSNRRASFYAMAVVLAIVAGSGCRLGNVTEPDLTGPAGYGVSIGLSATPDLLQRDGRTTSTIALSAYGPQSKPVAGLGLHLELRLVGGTGGLGTLSNTTVTTGADGRATATYTSPLPAPLAQPDEATVQILVTPIGTTGSSVPTSSISLRLVSKDLVGGPTASFVWGPKEPKIGYTILFDSSASAPSTGNAIVAWAWDFGDGNANPRVPYLMSSGPTITHEYNKSGIFTVGLTIIDSAGKRATATYALIVSN